MRIAPNVAISELLCPAAPKQPKRNPKTVLILQHIRQAYTKSVFLIGFIPPTKVPIPQRTPLDHCAERSRPVGGHRRFRRHGGSSAPGLADRMEAAERWVRSFRNDLLDHVIVLNGAHLRRLARDYLRYYHADRAHDGLGKDTPHGRPPSIKNPGERVASHFRSGGLHHRYSWQKAG